MIVCLNTGININRLIDIVTLFSELHIAVEKNVIDNTISLCLNYSTRSKTFPKDKIVYITN